MNVPLSTQTQSLLHLFMQVCEIMEFTFTSPHTCSQTSYANVSPSICTNIRPCSLPNHDYQHRSLGTTTTLRRPPQPRNIATKSLLLRLIPSPTILKRIQRHVQDTLQDFALAAVLDALDQFV